MKLCIVIHWRKQCKIRNEILIPVIRQEFQNLLSLVMTFKSEEEKPLITFSKALDNSGSILLNNLAESSFINFVLTHILRGD